MNILDHKRALTLVGATMTAISGACWGYVYAHRELEAQFDRTLEHALRIESEKVRNRYALLYKDGGPEEYSQLPPGTGDLPEGETPVVDKQHVIIPKEALATEEGREAVMTELEKTINPKVEVRSDDVHEDSVMDEVDVARMISERSAEQPYIVSREEYDRNEAHYETFELTFYEGDGVLMDDQDDPIPDSDAMVGDVNLAMFGVMSENNNVVYIQNDAREQLFRVTRSQLTASEAMFGPDASEEATLAHSSMRRRRPSRRDDE
jgi:hypothetical protein